MMRRLCIIPSQTCFIYVDVAFWINSDIAMVVLEKEHPSTYTPLTTSFTNRFSFCCDDCGHPDHREIERLYISPWWAKAVGADGPSLLIR